MTDVQFTIFLTVLLAGILVLVVLAVRWRNSRSRSMVYDWAAANELRIISMRRKAVFRGPFFLTTRSSQEVFRISVGDTFGKTRTGWIRCGNWFTGLLSDQVEVRWDGESNVEGFPVVFPARDNSQ
jgi:hypothetical protein